MRQSGALTLAAVLTLGGMTRGWAQELSGSVAAMNSPPFDGLVLPALPENWADVPIRLTASESLSYNSNVLGIPLGVPLAAGGTRGDFSSTSNYGFLTSANVSGQQLYLDASYGLIRYLRQVELNTDVYAVLAGVNWTLTSRCSGKAGVSLSKSPALITQIVGLGINYLTENALNETGKCAISNGYSLLFNSGLTDDTNSNPVDAVNNARTAMIAAGIEYAQGLSTVTALATVSDTSYTNRTAAEVALGLSSAVVFHDFTLQYARQINPNLLVTGLVGLAGVTSGFSLGLPKTLLPLYTLSTSWAFTPRLTLTASASRTLAPPTTVIANAQTGYNASTNLIYQLTPKVALNVGGAVSYTTATFTSGLAGTAFSVFTPTENTYTANAGLTYTMTPFLTAALTASYDEVVANHSITPQNLVTVSLNYKPY